jgi:hypothetical protein
MKYDIDEQKRSQQFIEGQVQAMSRENYPKWLNTRAQTLADAANAFLAELRGTEAAVTE